tara:strand:+ start:121 stop:321 length:201 start_codon:yes stop_codon:yes gene_type:complete
MSERWSACIRLSRKKLSYGVALGLSQGDFMVLLHGVRVSERNRFKDERFRREREMHIEERPYDPEK